MKTILAAVLFAVSTGAMAHGYSNHGHWHRHNNAWVWVVIDLTEEPVFS